MSQLFIENKLVIASHNSGKVHEIKDLLAPFGIDIISAAELSLPEPIEDGRTFCENADIKAQAAATSSGILSLADDSGLVVPALHGAPGIYSSRWAGSEKNFTAAMNRVWKSLNGRDAAAHFTCVLSVCWPDSLLGSFYTRNFEGSVHGHVTWPPRGNLGFGYDAMFVPAGYDMTFGEFAPSEKHKISHRAIAFEKLVAECFP